MVSHYHLDNNFDQGSNDHIAPEMQELPVGDSFYEELCASHSEDMLNIIGHSEAIQKVRMMIGIHGKYDAPVLVTGETGTGKELAARGLHYCGSRASKPFIAVNCATLTDDLFASEVFGHVKGSFTDAKKDKKGLLALAENGTLFLDEVDSLPLKSQAALLRLLQEGEYRPVGSEVNHQANVRLIASANCNLEERIRNGSFRADLYYRLYILSIHMPSLRDRSGDVPLLVEHFVRQFDYRYGLGVKSLCPKLLEALKAQAWPGNIRELENMIHRLYLCNTGNHIDTSMLGYTSAMFTTPVSQDLMAVEGSDSSDCDMYTDSVISAQDDYNFSRDKKVAVEKFEKEYVQQLMREARGNVTVAAKICGKERRAFGKLVKKYNIKKVASEFDE